MFSIKLEYAYGVFYQTAESLYCFMSDLGTHLFFLSDFGKPMVFYIRLGQAYGVLYQTAVSLWFYISDLGKRAVFSIRLW